MYCKFSLRVLTILTISVASAAAVYAGDEPPAWMRDAARANIPAYDKEVPAVALIDEQLVSLGSDGKLVTTKNRAIRLLNKEGRREAIARAFYLVSAGKIRDIQAWIIRPDGTTQDYDKKKVLDLIADPDDVYNEGRMKIIDVSDQVDTGYTFGYTVTSEELPLYYQEKWFAQDELPTLISRYTLSLPTGWKALSRTYNYADVKPTVNGSSYTWELRNLPFIKSEPMSPSVVNLVPWLAISYAGEGASASSAKSFTDWTQVSRWVTTMYEPQVVVNDEIAVKARELTANAKTELEKIRAIAYYVQNLQYISIDIGVGRGNGIRPRPSDLVLSRGYGDCKDKANLMRALLKSLKIEAYPIAIYSGDASFVREDWASPGQFNHCIIAIKLTEPTGVPTVIDHAKLGKLLIFDATDPFTPVGDLPDDEQGSFALIIAGENGGLSKMPVVPADYNTWNRDVEATITADGNINGSIKDKAHGQQSKYARAMFRSLSASEFKKAIESWLTRGATAASLIKLSPTDNHAEAKFDLDVEFAAPRYGQVMQNRLLVFKPAIVSRANSIYLTEKTRIHPVVLDEDSFSEHASFSLPAGFVVDEMPDPVTIDTPFGNYSAKYEVKDGKLLFSRSMSTKRSTIPVDKYEGVRSFFTKIRDAEQSPVVLIRK
jgi:hypothetical protein